ncbi:MAG: single-stranded DNA-binding protein [Anaerolineae bacterium]|nr:single-stranded DNA-binding protein [Anaerolineae bacterium]
MYQHTIIIGNVGRDPELRYTQGGVAVCDFSVAVNRRWTDRNSGQQREETTWFRVSCWRQLAETASQYVHKGMQIMVTGEIKASAYLGNDGQARASLELTARDVKFLSRKGERGDVPGGGDEGGVQHPDEPEDLPF